LPHTAAQIMKRPSKVIVIIDREARSDCPGDFAARVHAELVSQLQASSSYQGSPPVSVICADRSLENWLVADPSGLRQHAYIVRDVRNRVGRNADSQDAVAMIKWAYGSRRSYEKARDAPRLAVKVRTFRNDVRQRSKSLDKLLREAGV